MPAARTPVALFITLLVLTACATQQPEDQPVVATMQCGRQPIGLEFQGDQLWLQIGEETRLLVAAMSASGARYQAPDDEDTWFWNKGDTATLMLDGSPLPQCLEPGALEKPFEAHGNEPFWHLVADNGMLTLTRPDQDAPLSLTYHKVQRSKAVELHTDAALMLQVTEAVCHDTMSGMPYPRTVTLTLEGEQLSGCGGSPHLLLQGTEWQVASLGGEDVFPSQALTLSFDAQGRVSGRAACNRYTGHYTLTGDGVAIDRVATTKMACDEPTMEREQHFLALLEQVDRFDVTDGGSLKLISADQEVIRAHLPTP